MRQTLIHKSSVLIYTSTIFILALTVLTPITLFHPKPAKAASLPAYRYTKTFDTTSGRATGNGVATDLQGNIYIAGNFTGTVIFDGTGGHDSQTASHRESFLTKYNANGSYSWTKTFDTSASGAYAYVWNIVTDSQGNVYFTGHFHGTVIFDGTGGHDSQTDSSVNGSTYVTKYNTNGSYGWTKTFDASASGAVAYSDSITTDTLGNVLVIGNFTGTVIFDGTGGHDSQTAAGGKQDAFLTKYNANGSYAWTKTFDNSDSSAYASGNGVTIDSQGNIYTAGFFTGTVIFDGTGGQDSRTAANGNAFLTKYNANGSYSFTKILDTSASGAYAAGSDVAIDSQGNIYTTGSFYGTTIFDGTGGHDSQTDAGGNGDAFLTKYNANGSYGWTKTFDSTLSGVNGVYGTRVAIDSQNNVYMIGSFGGTTIFDGTGGHDSQTDAGGNGNSFLTKYSSNGSYGWTKSFDTTNTSTNGAYSHGLSIDSNGGYVYTTGNFGGTTVFDGPGGHDSQTDAGGHYNSFLTSYQAFTPSFSGPNNGDANNDGILDYQQPYVTTVNDSVSNNYAVLQASSACTNGAVSVNSEASNATQDSAYSYPAGLMNFTTNCVTHGFTATITLFFYGVNSSGLILRKYNASNHTYSNVPNASISQVTIAGQTVTKASYQITDGSSLDQDGTANGIIVDPVGLAKLDVSAPGTGYGISASNQGPTFIAYVLGAAGLGVLAFGIRRATKSTYRYHR